MNNKLSLKIAVAIVAVFITGCAKEPPKCSDENTFLLVRKIIFDQLGGRELMSEKEFKDNIRIEFARASAYDEKIKKYTCEANLITSGSVKLPITYESQLDDENQHIVAVSAISEADLTMILESAGLEVKKSHESNDGAPHPFEPEIETESSTIPDIDKKLNTQHGQLSIVGGLGEMQLMFNGKNLWDGKGLSLSFERMFTFGSKDVVLIMNNSGGTACPVQYFFVTLDGAYDAQVTSEFGTCSDLIETSPDGDNVIVAMPGLNGQQVRYVYSNGVISENGTPLK